MRPGEVHEEVHGRTVAVSPILQQVDDYVTSGSTEPLQFPVCLSKKERAALHMRAEMLGLMHESRGTGDERHIVVWKVN